MPIERTLLVNADDFGLHRDINRGILDCVERGRVQSVSFSPVGRAMDWAKLQELARHGIRIGIHVTLVGEPWATDRRVFRNWKELTRHLLASSTALHGAIRAEMDRQFAICGENGVDLTVISHVDSHQHVHMLPKIWRFCTDLARKHGIPRLRVPWAPSLALIKKNAAGMALQKMARAKRRGTFSNTLPCLGLAHAGNNSPELLDREIRIASGTRYREFELVAHPGVNTPALESCYPDWHFNWTRERDALLSDSFKTTLNGAGLELAGLAEFSGRS